MMQKNHH
jgi:hypothetical protein